MSRPDIEAIIARSRHGSNRHRDDMRDLVHYLHTLEDRLGGDGQTSTVTAGDLTAFRRRMGFTQAELAAHLGVAPRTICNWEKDGVPPSKTDRIAQVMDMGQVEVNQATVDGDPGADVRSALEQAHVHLCFIDHG